MLYSTSVKTTLGTFRIFCDNTGLTKIILPDINYTTPKNEKEETRIIPPLLELAAKQIIEYCKGIRTIFDLPLSVSGTIFLTAGMGYHSQHSLWANNELWRNCQTTRLHRQSTGSRRCSTRQRITTDHPLPPSHRL
jgi:hypothetical protein